MGNANGNLNQRPSYYSVEYLNGSSNNENITNYDYSTGFINDNNHSCSSSDLDNFKSNENRNKNTSLNMKNYSLDCLDKLKSYDNLEQNDNKSVNDDEVSYETLNYYLDTNEKKYIKNRSNSELLTTENGNQIRNDLNNKNTTNMLGLVRNGGVLVQRSKSFVKPENRVLPRELPTKPLRQTNLLKNDGYKRTWRNKSTVKKTNSTLAIPTSTNQSTKNNLIVKPSLIKSLQSHNSIDYLKQLNTNLNNFNNNIKQAVSCKNLHTTKNKEYDATSNDELSDFDDGHDEINKNVDAYTEIGPTSPTKQKKEIKMYSDDDDESGHLSSITRKQSISYSVENLNNEIKNFRDKYSKSMSNMDEEEEWMFDDKLGVDLKEEIFTQFGLKDKELNKNKSISNIKSNNENNSSISKSKPKITFKLNNDDDELNRNHNKQQPSQHQEIKKENKKKISKLSSWSLSIKEKRKPINKTNSIKSSNEKEKENKTKYNTKKDNSNLINKRDMKNLINEHEHVKLNQNISNINNNDKLGHNKKEKQEQELQLQKKKLKSKSFLNQIKSYKPMSSKTEHIIIKHPYENDDYLYDYTTATQTSTNNRDLKDNKNSFKFNNMKSNTKYDDFEILTSNKIKSKASTSSSLSTSSISITPPSPPLLQTRLISNNLSPPHPNLVNKSPSKLVNRIKSINRPQFRVKHKNSINNNNQSTNTTSTNGIKQMNRLNENLINNSNDIQIISRFPINSKVYRHYIAGNGNKIDKLTNSVDISNMIKTKSTCLNDISNNKTNKNINQIINNNNNNFSNNDNDLISTNERGIDVVFESNDNNKNNNSLINSNRNKTNLNFKSNSTKPLINKKILNDFDTIYDSIEDYNSTGSHSTHSSSSSSSSSSTKNSSSQDRFKNKMNTSSISSSSPASTSLLSPTSSSSDYYYKPLNDEINENNLNPSPNHAIELQSLNQRKNLLFDKINQQSTSKTSNDLNFRSSITSSSVLSALTSSSLVQTAPSFEYQSHTNNNMEKCNGSKQDSFISSVNVSFNNSLNNNYNNNMANLNKGFGNTINTSKVNSSFDARNESYFEECNYEMLSNANSANYSFDINNHKRLINVSNSGTPCKKNNNLELEQKPKKKFNMPEETKRLNERLQDEIQRAYEERTKRFNQVKIALQSNPSWLCDMNNLKILNQNKIISRKSFNESKNEKIEKKSNIPQSSIQKSPSFFNAFKQSNQSAFTKLNSNIKQTTNKCLLDLPTFYLKPPSSYDGDSSLTSKEKLSQEQEISIRLPAPRNNIIRARSSSSKRVNDDNFHLKQSNSNNKAKFLNIFELAETKSNNLNYQSEYNSEIIEFPPPPLAFKNTIGIDHKKKETPSKNDRKEVNMQSNETSEKLNQKQIGESRRKSTYSKNKNNSNFILRSKITDDSPKFNNEPILKSSIDSDKNKNDEQVPAMIIIDADNKIIKQDETVLSDKNSNRNKPARSMSKSRRKGLEEIFPNIKITRQSSMSTRDLNIESYDSINDKSNNFYQAKNLTSDYSSIYNLGSTLQINKKAVRSKSFYELSKEVEETTYNSRSRIDDPNWCPASDLYDFELDESDVDNSLIDNNNKRSKDNLNENTNKCSRFLNCDDGTDHKVYKFDYSKLNKNNFNYNNHSFDKLKNDILQPIGNLNLFYY